MEMKIRLRDLQDVKEFVSITERCDFDIDIYYNRMIIDAKSILGIMSMDLTKVLTVKPYTGKPEEFEEKIASFMVKDAVA